MSKELVLLYSFVRLKDLISTVKVRRRRVIIATICACKIIVVHKRMCLIYVLNIPGALRGQTVYQNI